MCLREISTQEYQYLHLYFAQICEKTSVGAKHPSPKVGSQAYEFWTTLVEDETERISKNVECRNYVRNCKESLIQLILEGLLIINFEDDDDEEDEMGH